MTAAKAIILDRDGTLIDFYRDPELGVVTPAFHPDHVRLLPGVVDGLRLLQDAGYLFAVATNQPDAAYGKLPRSAIERTNGTLRRRLADHGIELAAFECCMHHPQGREGGDPTLIRPCDCRKPKPGMLERICQQLSLDRQQSWMVGDTASDLGAAHAAGVPAALVIRTARCELCQLVGLPCAHEPVLRGERLDDIARSILTS